jgi:glycosyltransferase involved in cell wall biosynthesis
MRKIYINGKFVAQRMTGVQRFAFGVVEALDRSLQSQPSSCKFELLLPPSAEPINGLTSINQRHVGCFIRSLTAWEQIILPVYAADGALLCLSGSAPFFVRNCIPTIHDAAVFMYPQAYSRTFVTWYRTLFAHRAKKSRFVLTVSKASARDLASYLPSIAFRIVPNSAEHITREPSDQSVIDAFQLLPERYLLAVGSLNPTKNFTLLLKAYLSSKFSEQFPLVIVGAINKDVFRSVGDIPHCNNVLWLGPVPDAQLRALYEHAAVFVFPSLYEGFGIPPLEAMICGCPVVASNSSSIPEVCGDAALYFDPCDQWALKSAIQSLLTNNLSRSNLIENGRRRARYYSWDISAKRLRTALTEFQFVD